MRATPCSLALARASSTSVGGDAAPHPVGVDEEVLELTDLSGNEHRREADDPVIDDSDADSAVRDCTIGELECVGMGEQARAIAFVRERRSSKHIAECGQIFHRCETKAEVGQIGGDHVVRVPDAAECDLCAAESHEDDPRGALASPNRAMCGGNGLWSPAQSAWRVGGSEAVGRRMWSIGNGRPPSSRGDRPTTTKPSAS